MNATRRSVLLGAVSALALAQLSPAQAWFPHGIPYGAFQGNPNAIVSSVGGSITCLRTSGQTPCFIHASAAGITAVGTDVPYEDLEFNWNFGDPTGTEFFTRPTDGATVNANTAQISPEAFYCYRSAGIYTVTLTVRYQTAPGVYASRAFTQTITVSAYTATTTLYYDSNATGGTGDGSSPTNAKTSIADLTNDTYWNTHRTNHTIKLAKGSNWVGSVGLRIANGASLTGSMSGLRVEAYDGVYSASTAKPIIDVQGSTSSNLGIPCNLGSTWVNQPTRTKSDFVFSGISFKTTNGTIFSTCIKSVPGEPTAPIGTQTTTGYSYMYWDNCDCYSDALNVSGGELTELVLFQSSYPGGSNIGTGLYGGSYTTALTGSTGRRTLIGNAPDHWSALFGFTLSGSGGSSLLDHMIYPEVNNYALYKWIGIGNTGTGSAQLSFFLNLNFNGSTQQGDGVAGSFQYAQYQAVSECGVLAGVTQYLQFFVDGAQSNYVAPVFASGGSADIDATALQYPQPAYPAGAGVPPVNSQVAFLLSPLGGGALPTSSPQIVVGQPYYVVSKVGTTIQISETQGGAPITFTSTGTNVQFMKTAFRNWVLEKNGLTGFTSGGALSYGDQVESITLRGNRVWNYAGGSLLTPPGVLIKNRTKIKFYNNKIDSPSGLSSAASYTGDQSAYTQAQQFTDNVIVDRRASNPLMNQFGWTALLAAGGIVKNNAYYANNTPVFKDGSTGQNLATAQAAGIETGSTISPVASSPWGAAPTSWNGFG